MTEFKDSSGLEKIKSIVQYLVEGPNEDGSTTNGPFLTSLRSNKELVSQANQTVWRRSASRNVKESLACFHIPNSNPQSHVPVAANSQRHSFAAISHFKTLPLMEATEVCMRRLHCLWRALNWMTIVNWKRQNQLKITLNFRLPSKFGFSILPPVWNLRIWEKIRSGNSILSIFNYRTRSPNSKKLFFSLQYFTHCST